MTQELMPCRVLPIQHPRDFLTRYAESILHIKSTVHALQDKPEFTLQESPPMMRYEFDIDKLYIPAQFFIDYGATHILKDLQRYVTYVGVRTMRLCKGTRQFMTYPSRCHCFDLSKPHVLRKSHMQGPRAAYAATCVSADIDAAMRDLEARQYEFVNSLPDKNFHSEFAKRWRELLRLIRKAHILNSASVSMLERKKVLAQYRKTKDAEPPRERVRMPEFDELIKVYALGLIRRVDAYRMVNGEMVHKKAETMPFEIRDKWDAMRISGLYEETSHSDGTGYRKTLWLALHIVRNAVKEGKLPKNYMDDKRAVVKENKYLGKTTVRCLKLDMRR